MTYARSRQFEENLPRGAVPGRIRRNIVFVDNVMLQKELQTGAGKGSLDRQIPALKDQTHTVHEHSEAAKSHFRP